MVEGLARETARDTKVFQITGSVHNSFPGSRTKLESPLLTDTLPVDFHEVTELARNVVVLKSKGEVWTYARGVDEGFLHSDSILRFGFGSQSATYELESNSGKYLFSPMKSFDYSAWK
jgi:hypothetical protein